jgi:hypothetical protein
MRLFIYIPNIMFFFASGSLAACKACKAVCCASMVMVLLS